MFPLDLFISGDGTQIQRILLSVDRMEKSELFCGTKVRGLLVKTSTFVTLSS